MKEKNTIKIKKRPFEPNSFEKKQIKKPLLLINNVFPEEKNMISFNKQFSLKTPTINNNRNFFNQNSMNFAINENISYSLTKSNEFPSKNNKISSVFLSGNTNEKKYEIKFSKERLENKQKIIKNNNKISNFKGNIQYRNLKHPINVVNLHMNLKNNPMKDKNNIFSNSMPTSNIQDFPKLTKLEINKHNKNYSLYGMEINKIKHQLEMDNKKDIITKKIQSNNFLPRIKLKPLDKIDSNNISNKIIINENNKVNSQKFLININNIKMNSSSEQNMDKENKNSITENVKNEEKEEVKELEEKKENKKDINDTINNNENINKTEIKESEKNQNEISGKKESKQENINIMSFVNDLFSQKIPSKKNSSSINLTNVNTKDVDEDILQIRKSSDDLDLISFLKNPNGTLKNYFCLTEAGKNEEGPKINQDSILEVVNINNNHNFCIFGVFDGHGNHGHLISRFIVNTMKNIILKDEKLKELSKNTVEIYSYLKENNYQFIRDLIKKSENLLFENYEEESKYSGTTCNLIIIIGKKIICANIGDSRAIMIKNHKTVIELSSDQKPDNPNEKERIESKGGEIRQLIENNEPIGPMRVFKKNEDYPGIAMARSIGDKLADIIGVISDPEIKEFDIDLNCKYVFAGSDGIFEFLTNEKIAHIINKYYKKNEPKECCNTIVKKSIELWSKYDTVIDDNSIILIFFNQ